MDNIKWITHNPKKTGRYQVAIATKMSDIETEYRVTDALYGGENIGWIVYPNVKILCWAELPEFPQKQGLVFSEKMEEFLFRVDELCYEYGYEIRPDSIIKDSSIVIIGVNELEKIPCINGEGRGTCEYMKIAK